MMHHSPDCPKGLGTCVLWSDAPQPQRVLCMYPPPPPKALVTTTARVGSATVEPSLLCPFHIPPLFQNDSRCCFRDFLGF